MDYKQNLKKYHLLSQERTGSDLVSSYLLAYRNKNFPNIFFKYLDHTELTKRDMSSIETYKSILSAGNNSVNFYSKNINFLLKNKNKLYHPIKILPKYVISKELRQTTLDLIKGSTLIYLKRDQFDVFKSLIYAHKSNWNNHHEIKDNILSVNVNIEDIKWYLNRLTLCEDTEKFFLKHHDNVTIISYEQLSHSFLQDYFGLEESLSYPNKINIDYSKHITNYNEMCILWKDLYDEYRQ